MRELLIRYLLGELGPGEQRQLEEQLGRSPELRRELARLQSCFAAAHDPDDEAQLPRGLAERTTQRVTAHCCGDEEACSAGAFDDKAMQLVDPPPAALGWSLADVAVAGGVFLAVSMLLFPALRDSRDATRRNVCQNNQRQIGTLLFASAEDHGGIFPQILPHQNAGMFAVQLVEGGRIRAEDLAMLLVCPSAPLADQLRAGEFAVWIPSRQQLQAMSPAEKAQVQKNMSPFFAYQFPYHDRRRDRYVYLRDERSPQAVILSDTSGPHDDMSPNHVGMVQVLRGDGSIGVFMSRRMPGRNDDLFLNADGVVAAGCSRRDVVLGRSEATPDIEFAVHHQ